MKRNKSKTLDYYCDGWLKSCRSRVKESTYVKYEGTLNGHIKPKLGTLNPLFITSYDMDDFRDTLLYDEKLSPKTTKDVLVVVRSVLKYAAKDDPGHFPVIEINYPKDTKKEMRVLSVKEQELLITYLTKDMDCCKFGVLLTLFSGLRIGELCALQWGNVSVQDRTIKIEATMQRLKNDTINRGNKTKIDVSTPKSEMSHRILPLADALIPWCMEMYVDNPDAYILTGTTKFMEPRTLQYRLERYMKICGLKDVHFHTLRHTFATRCVEVGVEVKSLSEMLGHATTTITLDRYVHSSIELKRKEINKLQGVLR